MKNLLYRMLICSSILLFTHGSIFISIAGNTKPAVSKDQANQWIKSQSVQFIENKGQMTDMDHHPVPFVLYKVQSPGMDVYITQKGLTYVFTKTVKEKKTVDEEKSVAPCDKGINTKTEWNRIDMTLQGAIINKENSIVEGISTNSSNYFLAHCPNGITNVHSFQKITFKNIYPNIDWVLYNSGAKGFKYDFVVHPGADYKQIQLLYASSQPLKLDEQGNVQIKTKLGTLTENAPASFLNGKQIASQFIKTSDQKNKNNGYNTCIQFSIPTVTSLKTDLVIDPQLTWATFYGNGLDRTFALTTDAFGNLFVTGASEAVGFPSLDAGTFFQGTYGGYGDAFILKFDNLGVLIWATYYGGIDTEWGSAIAADASNNIFITGITYSVDFPVQDAGTFFQGANAGNTDVFVLKFDNLGNRLWATYYGGAAGDLAYSIAIDNLNNVFISGRASEGFPLQDAGTFFQGTSAGTEDAFILKFNNAGNRLWATYYGGSGSENGYSITVDPMNNVFVTGTTSSFDFPFQDAGTYFQGTRSGIEDAFILKFDNMGNRLWATYYGGGDADGGYSMVTDASGNLFICGITGSTDFPALDAGTFFQASNAGLLDLFILKFDNSGNRLWATYYGGTGNEYIFWSGSMALDRCGNLYLCAVTLYSDTPTHAPCDESYYDSTYEEQENVVIQFSNAGDLIWATFLGGSGIDNDACLTMDANNNLFVGGTSGNTITDDSYPLTNPGGGAYYDSTLSGLSDLFITKFSPISLAAIAHVSVINAGCSCTGSAVANATAACSYFGYIWNDGETTPAIINLCPGNYSVTITNTLMCDEQITIGVTLDTTDAVIAVNSPTICAGAAASLAASGTDTYSWSTGIDPTGINTAVASPLVTTTYTVTGISPGCYGTATFTVTVDSVPVININPVTICAGEVATLTATGAASYSWSTTDTTATINVTPFDTITYSVIGATLGCLDTATTTVIVNPLPVASGTGAVVCAGSAINLFSSGGETYSWTGPSSFNSALQNPTITNATIANSGTYTITVNNGLCTDTAHVNVLVNPLPVINITNDTNINSGYSATLNVSGGINYSWSPSAGLSCTACPNPVATPKETTTYCVSVDNGTCTDSACVTIKVEFPCPDITQLQVPDAFSPNNDGINDLFFLQGWGNCINEFSIIIFDRWGQKILESANVNFNWDGTYKGRALDPAVFVYYIKGQLSNSTDINKKGNITLIR